MLQRPSMNSMVRDVVPILGLLAVLLTAPQARADRYHVQSAGLRSTGPSTAGDWTAANCYADLGAALAQATPQDTVLLDLGLHAYAGAGALPALLANRDLDEQPADCEVLCTPQARLTTDGGAAELEIRGIRFRGEGTAGDQALLSVTVLDAVPSALRLHACEFLDLATAYAGTGTGGVMQAAGNGGGMLLEFVDSLFQGNACQGPGGAVSVADGYVIEARATDFVDNASLHNLNDSAGRGGAIIVTSTTTPTTLRLEQCRLQGNRSTGPGGAVALEHGSAVLIDTQILDSRSAWQGASDWASGAGFFMRAMTTGHMEPLSLEVRGCSFVGNQGDLSVGAYAGDGGGCLIKGRVGQITQVTVEESVFAENFAAQGAGLYIGRSAEGEVTRCSFRDNLAYYNGGGSYKGGFAEENLGETAVYRFCEFVGNRAGLDLDGTPSSYSYGGAFSTRLNPRAFFYNCSFLGNTANADFARGDAFFMESQGGVFDSDLKRCRLVNCLFWDETGVKYQVDTHAADAFIEITNCAMKQGELQAPDVTPVGMVWLTESPCSAPDDAHLHEGSPCIDAGIATGDILDLQGISVPQGSAQDIGAYEYDTNVATEDPELPPAAALETALQRPYPNPFNPVTTLRFSLVAPERVTLAVFDLEGRRVRTLIAGDAMAAGHHALTWDGRDAEGRSLPSGVYFARLGAGENVSRCRLMLAK